MPGLRSYPANQRSAIAERRLAQNTGGLGYWAAFDYAVKVQQLAQQQLRASRDAALLRNEQRRLEASNSTADIMKDTIHA